MALSERLRAELGLLSEESQAEVRRLAGEADADTPGWLRKVYEAHALAVREGARIDAAAMVRSVRDEA